MAQQPIVESAAGRRLVGYFRRARDMSPARSRCEEDPHAVVVKFPDMWVIAPR
jgi:hypothetical protein